MKRFHNALTSFVTAVLVMLIGFSGVSNPALAVAPSDSPLSISVTVTHSEDQEGVLAERVYFEVNLSPSPLMLMAEPPTQQRLEGEEIVYQYTAVSTANGPDNYTLSVSPTSLDNVSGSLGSFTLSPNTLSLGVTAASGSVAVGVLEIPVPSDGVSDGSINGIEAGDTVVIHGQKHTVDVVEDEPLEEISVIWLNEAHDSVINVGDLISEAATFELRITGVSIEDTAEDALVGMTVTGVSDTDTAVVAMHDTQTVVYAPIPAETQYFVRNISNPNGEGDPAYSTGDQSYYGTGGQMRASAGDELEYIIVQTAGNTGDLNNVVVTSTMPLFTTYIGNSTFLNGAPQADASDTAQSALIAGLDVGTIVRNGKAEVTFRVIVDDKSDKSEPKKEDQTSQDQGQQGSEVTKLDRQGGGVGLGRAWDPKTSASEGKYACWQLLSGSWGWGGPGTGSNTTGRWIEGESLCTDDAYCYSKGEQCFGYHRRMADNNLNYGDLGVRRQESRSANCGNPYGGPARCK